MSFLPINLAECEQLGWHYVDFVIVTGDAYVDHPSFGVAIISRVLESAGYKVAVLAQPNCSDSTDFTQFKRPRLGFLVTSGNIDSMVANYTVAKRKRNDDAYSEAGINGKRPDRAVDVYCAAIRKAYTDVNIIIGGLEASLRRFAHYDYWSDSVLPSILVSSKADILVYGMAERAIVEIAESLNKSNGKTLPENVRGTCVLAPKDFINDAYITLPSLKTVTENKPEHAKATLIEQQEHDAVVGKGLLQPHGDVVLVQHPPQPPVSTEEFDKIYQNSFMRTFHPVYTKGVPAIEEVEHSIIHNRGCFGACNFCSLAFHQGRTISSRSKQSVISEANAIAVSPSFKGYIHDVGGPTANFRAPSCEKQLKHGMCKHKKCLAPTPCKNLEVNHDEYLDILHGIRAIKGVKKVFIRSGIRYDYLLEDSDDAFFNELIEHHVSGQLKVAPEHCSPCVLDSMGKPHIETYKAFADKFYTKTKSLGKQQYLVPYLMSSHPGSTLADAIKLAQFLKAENIRPEQVQDFYPTPGTLSTAMFYTGIDPEHNCPIYSAKTAEEKDAQRALLQYFLPQNKAKVIKALTKANRTDLIGNSERCLVAGPVTSTQKATPKTGLKPPKRKSVIRNVHKKKTK